MIALFLLAQLSAPARDSPAYSSDALRTLIAEAATLNRDVPAALGGYRARIESEISMGIREASGRERAVSVEQVAGEMTFERNGAFEQHVTGYRTPSIGLAAIVGFFRSSWVTPTLYGGRIGFMMLQPPENPRGARRDSLRNRLRDSMPPRRVIHPLADDRERYYRFSGGDTVQVVNARDRAIPIVRIDVWPRDSLPPRSVVFGGEVDLDATRKHIVRMRGAFYDIVRKPQVAGGLVRAPGSGILEGLEVLQYVEFVNGEVEGRFWLPQYQRVELQIAAPILGDAKYVYRIVSHVEDFRIVAPDSGNLATGPDTAPIRRHLLTFASRDSLGDYRQWKDNLGVATSSVSADDLLDVGPMRWRADGPAVVTIQGEHASDLLHFNRIEGFFTGVGVAARMRDAAPGITIRATAGYAWSEETVRGRASAELKRDRWSLALGVARSLDITNDFRTSLDSGNSIAAMFGEDRYDYVDRYSAGLVVRRAVRRATHARVELGWADDRGATIHRLIPVFGSGDFLPNRGVDEGGYLRSAATLEWHPTALAESAWPGLGAALTYVRGDGQLNFQRVEMQLNARRIVGPWILAGGLHAGALFGRPPPQQLFEITASEYKEFAGDRAVALFASARYRFNVLSAPSVLLGRSSWHPQLVLPGIAPALSVGVTTAWTGASGDAARAAIARLGPRTAFDPSAITPYAPASVTTGTPRTSVGAALTFLGGIVGVGVSRATDHDAPWRCTVGFAPRAF